MLDGYISWMDTPEYREHQRMMQELEMDKLPKIKEPVSFDNNYWTKSKQ